MKGILFFAVCSVLTAFFMNYDVQGERDKERARIESLMRSADYQQAYARQLEAWR